MKLLFNDGWEFAKSSMEATEWTQLTFEPVDLPHDWLIYDTLNLYEDSIGWYRKRFFWTAEGVLSSEDANRFITDGRGYGQESQQTLLYFEEREFTLDPITGMQTVTFIFLPGSDFDFGWFRFVQGEH